jgi:hypothetical protein
LESGKPGSGHELGLEMLCLLQVKRMIIFVVLIQAVIAIALMAVYGVRYRVFV